MSRSRREPKKLIPCEGCGIAIQEVRGSLHAQGLAEHECQRPATFADLERRLLGIIAERAHEAPLGEVAKIVQALGGRKSADDGETSDLLGELRGFIRRDA